MSKKRISGIYKALLTQAGVAAPVAIVLENTLLPSEAAIVWSRNAVGNYKGTLIGAFVVDKTIALADLTASNFTAFNLDLGFTTDVITLVTANQAGASTDNILTKTSVTIEVFE